MASSTDSSGEELVVTLKQAQRASQDHPYFYVLIVKGTSGGFLLVQRKRIPPKTIAEARKEVGSNVVIKGVCYGGDSGLVFETPEDPQQQWANAAKRLAKEAGFTLHAEFKKGRNDDEAAEQAGTESQAEQQPQIDDSAEQAAFASRLKALIPKLAAATPTTAQAAKLKLGEANQLARQNAPRDWPAAMALVDAAEALLSEAPTQPNKGANSSAEALSACTHRLSGLIPAAKAAGNSALMMQKAKEAAALIQAKDVGAAQAAIEALAAQLASGGNTSARWKQAKQAWLDANDSLNAQLNALRAAVLAHAKAEPELAAALAEIADKGLNAITGNHRVKMMAALQSLGDGDAGSIKAQGPQALALIATFRAFLDANEQVDVCEGNPWDVEVSIRDTLYPALDGLEQALSA